MGYILRKAILVGATSVAPQHLDYTHADSNRVPSSFDSLSLLLVLLSRPRIVKLIRSLARGAHASSYSLAIPYTLTVQQSVTVPGARSEKLFAVQLPLPLSRSAGGLPEHDRTNSAYQARSAPASASPSSSSSSSSSHKVAEFDQLSTIHECPTSTDIHSSSRSLPHEAFPPSLRTSTSCAYAEDEKDPTRSEDTDKDPPPSSGFTRPNLCNNPTFSASASASDRAKQAWHRSCPSSRLS